MSDAVGEEYKHFSMDLEFLLRRTPKWREIAQGVLFQEGDIVEHGEAAEAAADDDGEPAGESARSAGAGRRRRLARHRQPARRGTVSHLLREHAPITPDGWKLIDEEARERLTPDSPRDGSSTSPARTAGSIR